MAVPQLRDAAARPVTTRRRLIAAAARTLGGAAVLAFLVHVFGADSFAAGLDVLTPGTIVLGLACGAIATVSQASRWRTVSRGLGVPLRFGASLRRCYEATFLNLVLPGGLVGDAVRAAQHKTAHQTRWAQSVGSVAGERLTGTVVIVVAAALALLAVDWVYTLLLAAVAAVLAALSVPAVRRLTWRDALRIYGLSVVSWAALTGMFVAAALVLAPPVGVVTAIGLGAVCLAAMSIPVNIAGWGPREGIAAALFVVLGFPGSAGVTVSAGYGFLALVSVLPGGVLLLLGRLSGGSSRRTVIGAGAPGTASAVIGPRAPTGAGSSPERSSRPR